MSSLPPGVVQGPDGKFRSVDDVESRYDDVELWTDAIEVRIPTGELPPSNQAEKYSVQLLDLDDLLDRSEQADLVAMDVRAVPSYLWTGENPNDDHFRSYLEISTASVLQVEPTFFGPNASVDQQGDPGANVAEEGDDSLDVLGRPLLVQKTAQMKDTTNTLGAGGSPLVDGWSGQPADPTFHPRDEIFVNSRWNFPAERTSGAASPGVHVISSLMFGVNEA